MPVVQTTTPKYNTTPLIIEDLRIKNVSQPHKHFQRRRENPTQVLSHLAEHDIRQLIVHKNVIFPLAE